MRVRPRLFALTAVMLALALALPLGAAPDDKPRPPEAAARHLYGIPAGVDLEKLVGKPKLASTFYYLFNDPASSERRLAGYAEVHAVFDIPLEQLVAVSLDFESYPSYVPRIMSTSILTCDESSWQLHYNVGIKFMGLGVEYESIFETVRETLPAGAVGTRSRLVRSIDQAEFEHFTSYYFCPVMINGKVMTFVRYFNRPGVIGPTPGMLQVLNLFAAPEAKGQVSALAKEAVRRSKLL